MLKLDLFIEASTKPNSNLDLDQRGAAESLMGEGVNLVKINLLEVEIFTPEKQTYKANSNL